MTTKARQARVIAVIQVKGGAGRSTVATTLAGSLQAVGRVALIDCDMPQGTAASWAALRQDAGRGDNLVADTAGSHRELVAKVEKYRQTVDWIVLDGPPRIAELTRAALVLSDLAIVPVGASLPEIWATGDLVNIISEARKVRTVEARVLWTRFRPHTRLAQELHDEAQKALGLKYLKTTLGYRVAYTDALGTGRTAGEMPDPAAREEVDALIAEIRAILK